MECDVDKKSDDENLGHASNKTAINPGNVSSKNSSHGKRKRKRPRTKALRRTIREKIEIALCTSDSPIQDILETDMDCIVSAPLSSIIKLLKLDTDEYQKLSCKALISIGNLSRFFSITGDSADTLQLVLKSNGLDHSSTVVYVDNLPHGCKVDSLEKWASAFGTVVFVHPIMERKINPNKGSSASNVSTSAEVSTSTACTGGFFQSAFIKFLDEQSPVDFIKFHQLLRKKAGNKRRKKLKLERKKTMGRNSVSKIRKKNKMRKKKPKKKPGKKADSSAKSQTQKVKNEEETVETGATDAEKLAMGVDNSNDVVKGEDGNYSRWRKRKRRSSYGVDDILVKKPKAITDEITDEPSEKTFRDVGTDVPEEFLLSEVGAAAKKRKRVHRQKRRNDTSKNRNLRPKKYFHNIQAYSLNTFQKLRARYLELQKQQMIQLKASLKKKGVPSKVSGLTKKEWKRKRGRCRISHCIPKEDKLADVQN
uniref:RRM domain-containing protein n=1 Tax=Wuchereria bancrofti TaxID=6293 RepID=A0AAF5PJ24_WUCBA